MTYRPLAAMGILVGCLIAAQRNPAGAQHPIDSMEFMFSNLRPSGQPVIPIFDGWYEKPDGTFDLCFGYFSLNTEEVIDIPVGPRNIVQPAQFNGGQPTHFLAVPKAPNLYRRYFCTFPVNVPKDFGKTAKVTWMLEIDGKRFSVPGHLGSVNYKIQELSAKEAGRSSVAPNVKFLPSGPEGRGRSGVKLGPLQAKVGTPLPLPLSVTGPPAETDASDADASDEEARPYVKNGKKRIWWVIWAKHQGVGEVVFNPSEIDIWEGEAMAATTATFDAPGTYVLRVQAIDNPSENASYQFHCCWTNGFVTVTVSE